VIERFFRRRRTGLRPELAEYLRELPRLAGDESMSEFWRLQLVRFSEVSGGFPVDAETIARLVESDYGFEALPERVAEITEDPRYVASLAAWETAMAVARTRKQALSGVDKTTWEHARVLGFLAKEQLLDEYVGFLSPLRIRSTMSTARHWYYARLVDRLIEEQHGSRRVDILEIGGGAGNLAYFLTVLGRVRSYTIVDLPEMLVHSGFTLATRLPTARLVFPPSTGGLPSAGEYRFATPPEARELPDDAFDVALNFNSFMEMDRHVRDGYIELIYRVGRPRALFVNVNRRQRALPLADGSVWDNNPLLYPYRDDEVLIWEEEPFQTLTRADFNALASLAVLRAGIIRATEEAPAA
jgi:putative sugar O-methyltransferase